MFLVVVLNVVDVGDIDWCCVVVELGCCLDLFGVEFDDIWYGVDNYVYDVFFDVEDYCYCCCVECWFEVEV